MEEIVVSSAAVIEGSSVEEIVAISVAVIEASSGEMIAANLAISNKINHASRKESREFAGNTTNLLVMALTKREVVVSAELELCAECVEA